MIQLISNDIRIRKYVSTIAESLKMQLTMLDSELDSCEILAEICYSKPGILLIDNDSLCFSAEKLISSIKKICKNTNIIFLTSDFSKELGSKILPLGIHYYALKPVSQKELQDVINSIIKKQKIRSQSS